MDSIPQRFSEHKFYGLFIAVSYGLVSITITLFNKAVFNLFNFRFPMTLFIAQMLISLFLVTVMKYFWPDRFGFPDFNRATAFKLLPMAIGWWTYGISGIIALKYLNVPMFSALRRFTTIFVMFGEYVVRGRVPPWQQQVAVLMMCGGAGLAGLTDLTFSVPGYAWASVCALSTATYLLFIDKLGRDSGLNDFGLLFYNNILSLPFMLGSWIVADELSGIIMYEHLHTFSFQIFFFVAAIQAFLLNFLIFYCTRVNSPLVTSLTGPGKDLLINAAGMTIFRDYRYSPMNMAAIGVCFLSSVWYTRLKYVAYFSKMPEPPQYKEAVQVTELDHDRFMNSLDDASEKLLITEKKSLLATGSEDDEQNNRNEVNVQHALNFADSEVKDDDLDDQGTRKRVWRIDQLFQGGWLGSKPAELKTSRHLSKVKA